MVEHHRQLFRQGQDHGQRVLGNRHGLHPPGVADDDASGKQFRQAERFDGDRGGVKPAQLRRRREFVGLQDPGVCHVAISQPTRAFLV